MLDRPEGGGASDLVLRKPSKHFPEHHQPPPSPESCFYPLFPLPSLISTPTQGTPGQNCQACWVRISRLASKQGCHFTQLNEHEPTSLPSVVSKMRGASRSSRSRREPQEWQISKGLAPHRILFIQHPLSAYCVFPALGGSRPS